MIRRRFISVCSLGACHDAPRIGGPHREQAIWLFTPLITEPAARRVLALQRACRQHFSVLESVGVLPISYEPHFCGLPAAPPVARR